MYTRWDVNKGGSICQVIFTSHNTNMSKYMRVMYGLEWQTLVATRELVWCFATRKINTKITSEFGVRQIRKHICFQIGWISLNKLRPRQNGRHFADDNSKCIFLNENVYISIKISMIFFSYGSNWQHSIIGSDNGLAPNRRQAIIWTNDGLCCRRIYVLIGLSELINYPAFC